MTSTNSSNNFLAALKINFRRHIAIFSVFQIFAFIVSAAVLIFSYDYYTDSRTKNITETYSEGSVSVFAILCIVEALVLVSVLFRELYSKRASDYYFSLPVKRGALFNANFIFGVITFAVSYAIFYVCSVLTINLNVFKGFRFVTIDAGDFLKYVFMSFVAVIVIYAVFTMCAVVSGRMWQYILLSFISSVVVFIGVSGFICYLNTIYGYWINIEESYTAYALGLAFSSITTVSVLKFFISAFVQFAVFYAAGYIAFKKRKAEVAENRLSGKVLPILLVTVCFLAEIFICLGIGSEVSLLYRMIAAVIIVVITAVVLSAIAFRKAMSKPVLASLLGAVILSAACILSVQFIPEKTYVYTVPKQDEIESATIYSYGYIGSTSLADLLYGSSYLTTPIDYENDKFIFSTDEGKEKFIDFHNKILADETRNNVYSADYYANGNAAFGIEYKLKNGKTIKRLYEVATKDVVDEYVNLLKADECINKIPLFQFKPEDILFVTAEKYADEESEYLKNVEDDLYDYFYEDTVFMENVDANKLRECILEDMKNADSVRFLSTVDAYIDLIRYDYGMYSWYDEEPDLDTDLCIVFYQFHNTIADTAKKRLEKLSPKEILIENDRHFSASGYNAILIDDYYFSINTKEDKNTMAYLKELGYNF